MDPTKRSAFTLVELLVVIGIIVVLAALVFPLVGHSRESARRAAELSYLRQLTAACIAYSQNNESWLPPGRIAAANSADDYTWVSLTNCWSPLLAIAPSLSEGNSCPSVRDGYTSATTFARAAAYSSGAYQSGYGSGSGYPEYPPPSTDTTLGWIYWGGRDDLYSNGVLKYRSIHRIDQKLTPGSQTLWTCLCWDSAGNGGPSVCPHVGSTFRMYGPGVTLQPPPDGLGVALTDGSAAFVHWTDLITIQQANGYKLYYEP